MKQKMLLLGATGLIGRQIWEKLSEDYEMYGTYGENGIGGLDCRERLYRLFLTKESMDSILARTEPDLIISALRGDFAQQMEVHEAAALYLKNRTESRIFHAGTTGICDYYEFQRRACSVLQIPVPYFRVEHCPEKEYMVLFSRRNLPEFSHGKIEDVLRSL